MRVLIYGGRDFGDPRRYEKDSPEFLAKRKEHALGMAFLNNVAGELMPWLEPDEYGNTLPVVTVISGMARGADMLGVDWATVNWTELEEFPADWDKHGKAAGHIRNQQMLDSGVDLAVQFPGGRGTADMRRRLDKAGVTVREYHEAD